MYLKDKNKELRTERCGDRISVGARYSAPVQTVPDAHTASYTKGTGSLPGESGRYLALTTHLQISPSLKKE
jgi:hypothetical protein